jgi:hypothetical protein
LKSLTQLGEYLKSQNLAVRASQNTAPAESLPLALLPRLAGMKDGQTVFTAVPGGARLVTVLQARSAPVSEEQARPAIEQFLANDLKRKAVEQDMKSIRTAAQVQYVGQYAAKGGPPAEASSAASAADAIAPAVPVGPATAPASGLDAANVDKGLAGLK